MERDVGLEKSGLEVLVHVVARTQADRVKALCHPDFFFKVLEFLTLNAPSSRFLEFLTSIGKRVRLPYGKPRFFENIRLWSLVIGKPSPVVEPLQQLGALNDVHVGEVIAFPFNRDTVFFRVGCELNEIDTVVTEMNLNTCMRVVQGAFSLAILRFPEDRYHLLGAVTETNSTYTKR